MSTSDAAQRLRELHHAARPLLLPNAWDAASARAFAAAGFPAVATSSSAVAAALGHGDGQRAPVDEVLAAVTRIARAVPVPVTADLEAGYGMGPAELVERLAATGAVGCNLEDTDHDRGGLVDPAAHADWLAAVRAAATTAGTGLVVNARVDTFLPGRGADAARRLPEAVARAARYLEAGADCVYPIMAAAEEDLAALVRDIPGPVNVLYRPGVPSLPRLAELGVARVSFGGGLHEATLRLLERMAGSILAGADPYKL